MLFFNSIIFHFFLVHCLLHFAVDARSFDSYFSTFFSELHCLSNLLHTAAVTSIKCSKTALCSPPLNMMIPFVRHAVRRVFFGVHPAGWQNWSELKNGKMWHGRSNDSYIMWQVISAYLWADWTLPVIVHTHQENSKQSFFKLRTLVSCLSDSCFWKVWQEMKRKLL